MSELLTKFRLKAGLSLGIATLLLTGCQTWSGLGFGNPARVPPPATGTYQPPIGYYNNSSAGNNAAVSGVVSPVGTIAPAGNLTAGNIPIDPGVMQPTDLSGVQPAAFVPAGTSSNVAIPAVSNPSSAAIVPATGSLRDLENSGPANIEQPSLRWQP